MLLNEFMNENFPNLELRPPVFYSWKIGIRFELGVDYDSDFAYENSPYLQGVYKRVITLFKSLHSNNDDIYIVVDVSDYADDFKLKSKTFSRYIKGKSVLYGLNQKTIIHDDDEEGTYKTHRFTLKCKTSDFKYIPMLKAICNQDMGIRPSIFNMVYFININRKTIFHVYDDRGCDLVATSRETIRDVYDNYNDWILAYDRNEIDGVFK
ncbi:DUF3885 domain-containing protein [Peribacillus sp. ACCC06369]|uniref:DUF3885 domain-containing protein n=1 Tax=Peribacillus sp. ACCC06369 TaxID=3055860 RepID=UPI0025A096F0|nr:DUF3885 domain-containing protein [Peribacillus sp. ACCC06369]MDM5360499.1 DUF3885 domain-containing protein [Peribacillus sp. ACCC06369]